MHAIVSIWSADESRRAEQERALRTEVLPGTTALPGFAGGYWMRDAETGKVHTLVIFDTQSHALAYKEHVLRNARAAARVGVTADIVAVVEVSAHA
jgi:hypothetical protein